MPNSYRLAHSVLIALLSSVGVAESHADLAQYLIAQSQSKKPIPFAAPALEKARKEAADALERDPVGKEASRLGQRTFVVAHGRSGIVLAAASAVSSIIFDIPGATPHDEPGSVALYIGSYVELTEAEKLSYLRPSGQKTLEQSLLELSKARERAEEANQEKLERAHIPGMLDSAISETFYAHDGRLLVVSPVWWKDGNAAALEEALDAAAKVVGPAIALPAVIPSNSRQTRCYRFTEGKYQEQLSGLNADLVATRLCLERSAKPRIHFYDGDRETGTYSAAFLQRESSRFRIEVLLQRNAFLYDAVLVTVDRAGKLTSFMGRQLKAE